MEGTQEPTGTTMTRNDKILLVVGIAAAIGLFLLGKGCGIKSVTKQEGTVKEVRKDSLVYVDRPVPFKVTETIIVNGKPTVITRTDTLETFEVRVDPADTAAILARFYDIAYYNDVRDTGRAAITITDTVTQNRIQGRSVKVVFTDSVITNTVTLRPPQRLILFFGVSALGNFNDPFHMAGADLTLKTPTDRQYTIGANVRNDGKLFGEVGVKFPIRFRKRQ